MNRKIEILYYTPYFNQTLKEAFGFEPEVAEDLCIVSTDYNRLWLADAVVFHIPNIRDPKQLPPKRHAQIWVAMSMESDANYPLQSDPDFMRNFDICMNFRREADVRMLYFDEGHLSLLRTASKEKCQKSPAVYFASNDFALNNRFDLVHALMQHMPVDSYGKSQNNCTLSSDTGRMTKLDIISTYPFYFAFENSNSVDYVSEKVFDGLIVGTVPVYLGAPNIDEFLPGNNCIIKASDFANAAELAKFLIELRADTPRYESYVAWKTEPYKQGFLDLVELNRTQPLRRLCHKIIELSTPEARKLSSTV